MADRSTRVTQHVRASRQQVYRALLDAQAVATWMVPDGMTSQIHEFDAREGGRFQDGGAVPPVPPGRSRFY